MNTDEITDEAKYVQGWRGGLPETECGRGSTMDATRLQRTWIPQIFAKYGIRTVADIGAGDLNWLQHTDLSGIEYRAYDLVPRHPSVTAFNLIEQVPPKVDCLMCLWVLNHMPYDACKLALANLFDSGSTYLLMTDRPKWHAEQPPEIQVQALDALLLNEKGDRIKLVRL
jgi:hypothetical protein